MIKTELKAAFRDYAWKPRLYVLALWLAVTVASSTSAIETNPFWVRLLADGASLVALWTFLFLFPFDRLVEAKAGDES